MPCKVDKMTIKDPFLKQSVKLLPCQKEMAVFWRNRGLSFNKIAAMFHVSKRLIQFICDPEKHKANLERRKERGGSNVYYNKEKNTEAASKHRALKNELFIPKQPK